MSNNLKWFYPHDVRFDSHTLCRSLCLTILPNPPHSADDIQRNGFQTAKTKQPEKTNSGELNEPDLINIWIMHLFFCAASGECLAYVFLSFFFTRFFSPLLSPLLSPPLHLPQLTNGTSMFVD